MSSWQELAKHMGEWESLSENGRKDRIAKAQEFLDMNNRTGHCEVIYNPTAEKLAKSGYYGFDPDSDMILSPNDIEILLETGVLKIDVHGEYTMWLRVHKYFSD